MAHGIVITSFKNNNYYVGTNSITVLWSSAKKIDVAPLKWK